MDLVERCDQRVHQEDRSMSDDLASIAATLLVNGKGIPAAEWSEE
jgi:hypothetical protein